MKYLFYILFFLSSNSYAQISFFDWKENPDFAYAKVHLYNLRNYASYPIVINGGQLSNTIHEPEDVKLTQEQSEYVISIINGDVKGDKDQPNMCFTPHHGIVFYDEGDNPVAHISICLYCEGLMIFPKTDKPDSSISLFKDFFKELGIPVFNNTEDYEQFYYEWKALNPDK